MDTPANNTSTDGAPEEDNAEDGGPYGLGRSATLYRQTDTTDSPASGPQLDAASARHLLEQHQKDLGASLEDIEACEKRIRELEATADRLSAHRSILAQLLAGRRVTITDASCMGPAETGDTGRVRRVRADSIAESGLLVVIALDSDGQDQSHGRREVAAEPHQIQPIPAAGEGSA
jgi:hypothetical protein